MHTEQDTDAAMSQALTRLCTTCSPQPGFPYQLRLRQPSVALVCLARCLHPWGAGAVKMQAAASPLRQLQTPQAQGGDAFAEGDDALAGEAPAATADKPRTLPSSPAVECPSAGEARVMGVRVCHHCTPCQVLSTEVPWRTDPTACECSLRVLCSMM